MLQINLKKIFFHLKVAKIIIMIMMIYYLITKFE